MKKSLLCVLAVAAIALLSSCGTTTAVKGSGVKGKKASIRDSYVSIIDYQGASFGSEIPAWVVAIGDGNYSGEYLSTIMPGVDNKKVFVIVERGDNLKAAEEWATLVGIEVQVGDEMQRVVGKAVEATQKQRSAQTGDSIDATKMEQELNMYKQAVSAVELNGLEKVAQYWIQKEVKKDKKDNDPKVYYEYYAVWGMNKKIYDLQLKKALEGVDDNTDEGKALKEALSLKLQNMVITTHDAEVAEEADSFID